MLSRPSAQRRTFSLAATLSLHDEKIAAEVAWVIGVTNQCRGYATEAADAMLDWLGRHEVNAVEAHIGPRHAASIGVARNLGLVATPTVVDGETRWAVSLPD